jgi:hypothetical protein
MELGIAESVQSFHKWRLKRLMLWSYFMRCSFNGSHMIEMQCGVIKITNLDRVSIACLVGKRKLVLGPI